MRKVQVQQLSEEAFRKYGSFQNVTDNKQMASRVVTGDGSGTGGFYADLIWMDFLEHRPPSLPSYHKPCLTAFPTLCSRAVL